MTNPFFVFGNNIDTQLTSGITNVATTIPVASVANFPTILAGQYLALTLIHPATLGLYEIVYVTAISGLNLTVLREQEGSTAVTWAAGDTIFSDITQGVLKNFVQETVTYSYRNKLINGLMYFDQRNNGASGTGNGYTLDRWQLQENTGTVGKLTWGQNLSSSFGPPGFPNVFGLQVNSSYTIGASDFAAVCQYIEAYNTDDLAFGTSSAQPITLSFWVYTSLAGTYGGCFRNAGANRSYPFSFTCAASTWTFVTITAPGDTTGTWPSNTNSSSLHVFITLAAGSTYASSVNTWQSGNLIGATGATSLLGTLNATFYITGVQLESGYVATPFERREISTESALCFRYYEALPVHRLTGVTNQPNGDTRSIISWIKPKRATPSVGYTGSTSVIAVGNSGTVVNVSLGTLTISAANAITTGISNISNYAAFSGAGNVFAWGDDGTGSLVFTGNAEL